MTKGRAPTYPLDDRIDAYAAWVRDLRRGSAIGPLVAGADDPLARLGRELELLSDTLTRRESELQSLFDLVKRVESGVLLDDILNRIFDGFSGLIPFERIGCAFLSDDGSRLVSHWVRSNLGPVKIRRGFAQRMAGSSLEAVLRTGQPRIINDLEAYLAAKPGSVATRRIVEEGGRASLTCPLVVEDRPIGFIFFTSRRKDVYSASHQTVFQQIAGQVATVIGKSRIYEELLERNRSLAERSSRFESAASRDALTGLLNRGAIDAILQRMLSAEAGPARDFGVIIVDIDHFKSINDSLGHAAGDAALKQVAARLAGALRKHDQVGRYGGEEFLVLVNEESNEAMLGAAERLRRTIADQPFDLGSVQQRITASFGVAHASGNAPTPADLVARADRALYSAKEAGRNRCVAG